MDRTKWIGGTDVAAICGVSPWKTPMDVYLEKVGESDPIEDNENMFWGRALESAILDRFEADSGAKLQRQAYLENGFYNGNLDGLSDGWVVDAKTSGKKPFDEVPDEYVLQLQHYMFLAGKDVSFLPTLHFAFKREYRCYEIPRDSEMIEIYQEICGKFWNDHVLQRVPPAFQPYENRSKLFKKSEPIAIEASDDIKRLVQLRVDLKQRIKEINAELDLCEGQIQEFMAEHDTLLIDGQKAITWKSCKGREMLDAKAFKSAHPDIYSQFLKTGNSYRRFV